MDENMNMAPETPQAFAPALPVDSVRLQEFDLILRKYKAGKAHLEKRVVQAEQWWKLRNEEQARKEYDVAWDRDFRSRSGWLHNVLVSKHADAMENYPEALVLPRAQNDKQQAEMLSRILPCVLDQTGFEDTYSSAWWRKLKTGTAVYKCVWDADALHGLGEIAISDVDLLSVFWEPGVRDIQDSRYFFHVELHDNDLLEEQYPELTDKLKGNTITLTKYIYDDSVPTDGKSVVVDVYYKKGGVLHYCKYCGDTVLYSTENEEAEGRMTTPSGPFGATPKTLREGGFGGPSGTPAPPMPMGGVMPGVGSPSSGPAGHLPPLGEGQPGMAPVGMPAEPQHRGLYDDGMYPFVFDTLFPIEGSPCGYGYVDICANPQIAIDIMRTAFIKNVKAGATPRYFIRTDGAVNEQELLDLTKALVHVNGGLDEQFLRVVDSQGLPDNYQRTYDALVAELRETSGNTESANGITGGGVTAASSIAALQEASGKTIRDASRASYRAFKKLIHMVLERIRQFYDLPRQFRITGQFGQEEFVTFDNSAMKPQPVGLGSTQIGYTQPVYDIRIEVQKRNAYNRTSQNELALQLYQLGVFTPGNEEPSLRMLEMMDFDGRDELMQKLQQRQMMMQMMMGGPAPAPAPGGAEEQPKLEDPTKQAEDTHLRKARERSNQASSL